MGFISQFRIACSILLVQLYMTKVSCLNETEYDFDYSTLNVESDDEFLLELVHKAGAGEVVASEIQTLFSFSNVSDVTLLTAFYKFTQNCRSEKVRSFSAVATAQRPALVLGIVLAGIQGREAEAAGITLGAADSLLELGALDDLEVVVSKAMAMTSVYPSLISQKLVEVYPEIRSNVITAIQSLAAEEKSQTITSAGGTITSNTGEVEITVPMMESEFAIEVELHTYDCKLVTTERVRDGAFCHALLPHSFPVPVSLSFKVPDDGQPRKCRKTNDEVGENWEDIDCQSSDGRMTYTSSTFSIIRATSAANIKPPKAIPSKITVSEVSRDEILIPAIELPQTRFKVKYDYLQKGIFNEYLETVKPNEDIFGENSGRNIAMGRIVLNKAHQRLYWSDGSRIQTVLIQDALNRVPIHGAPTTVLSGQIIIRLRGENLGIDLDDIIGVQVADQRSCIVNRYISDKEIECVIETDYDLFAKVAAQKIKLENILVSTHRRAKDRAIPIVSFYNIDIQGRKPNALYLHDTKTLFWAEENSRKIMVSFLSDDLKTAIGDPKIILHNVSATDLLFVENTSSLYYTSSDGYVERLRLNQDYFLDETQPKEKLVSGLGYLTSLALDSIRQKLYVGLKLGRIIRVDLEYPYGSRIVLRRPSRTRLDSIFVQSTHGPLAKSYIFWSESDSKKIMKATLSGMEIQEVVTNAVWTKGLLVFQSYVYWSEYLGQVWRASDDPEYPSENKKELIYSQLGSSIFLSKTLETKRQVLLQTQV